MASLVVTAAGRDALGNRDWVLDGHEGDPTLSEAVATLDLPEMESETIEQRIEQWAVDEPPVALMLAFAASRMRETVEQGGSTDYSAFRNWANMATAGASSDWQQFLSLLSELFSAESQKFTSQAHHAYFWSLVVMGLIAAAGDRSVASAYVEAQLVAHGVLDEVNPEAGSEAAELDWPAIVAVLKRMLS